MTPLADFLKAKILIVDDLEVNVLLLARMLGGAGYSAVDSTSDPRAVCELHRKNHYDLILLDLQMPLLDGFEVLERLRELETDGYVPVLVITAQPSHKLRALNAGAKDFVSKPFDLAEVLTRVHNLLEVRLYAEELKRTVQELQASHAVINGKNDELKKLFEQVVAERKVSERLALQVEPSSIAKRLQARNDVATDGFGDVTVLVADVVGFADLTPKVGPERLASILEEIFALFDELADARGVKRVKTHGNSYMAASGVPVPAADHATRMAHLSLDMIDALHGYNQRNEARFQVRIGVDSGSAIAAVIGRRLYLYDLWGQAVNGASRMESHGVAGRVQVSDGARRLLSEPFLLAERGTLELEDAGEVKTWFLEGRRPHSAQPLARRVL